MLWVQAIVMPAQNLYQAIWDLMIFVTLKSGQSHQNLNSLKDIWWHHFTYNCHAPFELPVLSEMLPEIHTKEKCDFLNFKAPNKNCSRRHFNFLLLSFEENKACCSKWICLAEDSLGTSSLIFSEKQWKIIYECHLLQLWLALQGLNL